MISGQEMVLIDAERQGSRPGVAEIYVRLRVALGLVWFCASASSQLNLFAIGLALADGIERIRSRKSLDFWNLPAGVGSHSIGGFWEPPG